MVDLARSGDPITSPARDGKLSELAQEMWFKLSTWQVRSNPEDLEKLLRRLVGTGENGGHVGKAEHVGGEVGA